MSEAQTLKIDHIFLFSQAGGRETDTLVAAGLAEGSGRSHPGLGTQNRRVFFENFYLEVLWVHDETEARASSAPGIWERALFRETGASRLGLCLANTAETDALFRNAIAFEAAYNAPGAPIEILTTARMPWIFRLPHRGLRRHPEEPKVHQSGMRKLTKARFTLRTIDLPEVCATIAGSAPVEFETGADEKLTLEFDGGARNMCRTFEDLALELRY